MERGRGRYDARMPIAIIVHGGAGPKDGEEQPQALMDSCLAVARAGFALLKAGGAALDVVQRAAELLEDDPHFNAGTGSCLNADGRVEMDAALMDGQNLKAGAVCVVSAVKNPIQLARAVMERTPHVLLAGEAAHTLGDQAGIPRIDPAQLVTDKARRRFERAKSNAAAKRLGTIGAVAIDSRGHLAAATSTGGITLKRPGRVGDSPLIGAGTYADDTLGAVSATGLGEAIIRVALGFRAVQLLPGAESTTAGLERALSSLDRVGGSGGIIGISPRGEVGFAFNTERMSRAWVTEHGEGAGFGR